MERRGFLGALFALPFMKWALPKQRPAKVTVYFPIELPPIPIAPDGELIFARYVSKTGNIIEADGCSKAEWVKLQDVMKAWGENG